MEQPLVSIITNTRNRANLLHRCIESIQKQTYQNYEHIIVDGDSTDNTEQIVKSYSDPRIKYIKLNYCGPAKQMKAGFLIAQGELFTFLDDDDEYLPTNLEEKVNYMISLPADFGLIYSPMDYYDYNSGAYLYTHEAYLQGGRELLPILISKALVCGTPTLMFKRKAFEDIGGAYVDNIGNNGSDWILATQAIVKGWKVGLLNKHLVKVFVNHPCDRLTYTSVEGLQGAKNTILFYEFILSEFCDIIKDNPESAIEHYKSLIYAYCRVGKYRECFKSYYRLLIVQPSVKNFIRPFYALIKNKFNYVSTIH